MQKKSSNIHERKYLLSQEHTFAHDLQNLANHVLRKYLLVARILIRIL